MHVQGRPCGHTPIKSPKLCSFRLIPSQFRRHGQQLSCKPTSESSSRCLTECLTTAHNFEIIRFSLLEGMGAGKFISSSKFSIGGYDWKIRIYPDGWKEEDKAAYMSVFLCFYSRTARDAKVKFTLSLLAKDGKVRNVHSTTHTFQETGQQKEDRNVHSTTHTFQETGQQKEDNYWGRREFIEKPKLQELRSRNDDCFTIRCVLTVMKVPRTEDVSTVLVPVPQSNLHTHFANMLKGGEGVDVTFSVGDKLFSAHRYVLAARSPVFKAELFGQMKETTMKCLKIDGMEPSVFEALLHFIYTDSLPSNNSDVDQNAGLQHLLVAADRYGLDRLRAMCEAKLCQSIDVQTVATTLALAEQHNSVQLKNACLGYLCSQDVLRVVKGTDGFKHLIASCPWIMMDILEKVGLPSRV